MYIESPRSNIIRWHLFSFFFYFWEMSRPSVFLFASKHNSNSYVRFLFPFSIMTGSSHTTGLCKVGELVKYKERAFMKFQPLHGHGFLSASLLHTCGIARARLNGYITITIWKKKKEFSFRISEKPSVVTLIDFYNTPQVRYGVIQLYKKKKSKSQTFYS